MSAAILVKEYANQKAALIELKGKEKYEEELEKIKKIESQEAAKGNFEAVVGDIDNRGPEKRDI